VKITGATRQTIAAMPWRLVAASLFFPIFAMLPVAAIAATEEAVSAAMIRQDRASFAVAWEGDWRLP
jgi:hypothetical protein